MKREEIFNCPKLDIQINTEPILTAFKADDQKFYIFDKWKSFVAVFGEDLMIDFFNGNESIMDSKGRLWYYNDVPENEKIPKEKLYNFMNISC